MKKVLTLLVALVLLLAACGDKKDDKKVTIGIASNDTAVWDKVKELAKRWY